MVQCPYEAGIRMRAGGWTPGAQITGFILVGDVWAIALPLFFYWDRAPIILSLVKNP
ncbi:hypothetical protein [Polynucleobacter necessarius]|uniref:hypothetical protein n=1 Tax=Polynucleobacter necessarius TaxID=576610 RepID=UPI0013B065B1|nr:hypothetical protein [Polynucleobacter necessarius]